MRRRQVRGRPPTERQRHVVQDLIEATERALAQKTAKEITIREISTAAGTSEAMVRYYFGNKDGLLLAVIHELMDASPHRREQDILTACVDSKSIKPLVDALCKFHYARPNLVKMIVVELLSAPSKVKDEYMRRYGNSINTLVQFVIQGMQKAGVYKSDLNSVFLGFSLTRLVVGPLMESAVAGTAEMPPEIKNGEWATFIATTIDSTSI
jgi:AcrR family transcriptional regulator